MGLAPHTEEIFDVSVREVRLTSFYSAVLITLLQLVCMSKGGTKVGVFLWVRYCSSIFSIPLFQFSVYLHMNHYLDFGLLWSHDLPSHSLHC